MPSGAQSHIARKRASLRRSASSSSSKYLSLPFGFARSMPRPTTALTRPLSSRLGTRRIMKRPRGQMPVKLTDSPARARRTIMFLPGTKRGKSKMEVPTTSSGVMPKIPR
jgi:hypothetical protein